MKYSWSNTRFAFVHTFYNLKKKTFIENFVQVPNAKLGFGGKKRHVTLGMF